MINNKFKILAFLSVNILISGFLLRAPQAKAFSFVYDTKIYEVDEEMQNSWKGAAKLPALSIVEKQVLPELVLSNYFGSPARISPKTSESRSFKYRPEKIYEYLKTLAREINTAKIEPVLKITDFKAENFEPPQDGILLNTYDTAMAAAEALEQKAGSQPLLVEIDKPTKSLADTNTLGINTLVAAGESNFKGSPKNRIHNIKVGIGKFKGIIIKPGEEFSFNKFLGPVEEEAGFLPELVIKRTGTVPELGGGLCQVSSTTFRAAMNAGLPITQRKNHSYAVQYYAPQGTDATIYPGAIDLKFINDTPGHILIRPYIKDNYTLIFEFYGTKDSRKVTLQKPIQYDRKSDGSMKAEWTRVVENKGTTSTSTFKSTYLPPALFHKEETFVSSTTTVPSGLQAPNAN